MSKYPNYGRGRGGVRAKSERPHFLRPYLPNGGGVSGGLDNVQSLVFLAAMSSSRSDVVTQFVCSFVCSFVRVCVPFFLFMSLKFLLVLKSFIGVSRKFNLFLAAMSSSRSDVVTQSVRSFVRVSVPFFSFSVIEVSSRPKEFQWCFKAV